MKKDVLLVFIILIVFTNTIFAQKMTVKDSDSHVLMEVNDEGTMGSITLPDTNTALSSEINKLYNLNGSLIWNGTALGAAGSAGGWTDDGTVVRLTTSTDKVGIGDTSPTHTLDVAGTIGINDTTVLFLPDQADFRGTLIVGNGGGDLINYGGAEGWYNTAVGIGALNANTTGNSNTAGGYQALYSNTEGYSNTAFGYGALNSTTTGDCNTASGYRALQLNTAGNYNTAFSDQALYANTTGSGNVGIGYQANYLNEAGSNNTIIGYEAGRGTSVHDKSGNVFIGYQAGYNETGDNKLYIENSNSSSPLIGGDFDADEVYLNGKVGIGDTSPTDTLDVAGTIGINDTTVLFLPDQADFRGTLIVGNGGGDLINYGGAEGWYNTAVGIGALNANTTGNSNTAGGYQALYSNTEGYSNTAFGYGALNSTTTGDCNTASGYRALQLNTAGNYNTAFSDQALYANTTGSGNMGIGYQANYLNEAGSNNTIIGYEAGRGTSVHDKSGNVFIGYQAGYSADEEANRNIFIGYQAGYSETDSCKLYIENSNSSSPLIYGDFSTDRVGINTNNPGTAFAVVGLTGTSSYNNVRVNTATGDFYYETSSRRHKEDIQNLEDDFHKILDVEPRSYRDKTSGQKEIGYIAEEFEEKGLKDLVIYNDNNIPDGLRYDRISLYLVEVVKEQQKKIAELEERINELQK